MPLHWGIEKVADYKRVCYTADDSLSVKTKQLIFATMRVGISRITEKNWPEFFTRLHMIERADGTLRTRWEGENPVNVYYTPDEVREHIGLWTTASSKTNTAFHKMIITILRQRGEITLEDSSQPPPTE